VLESPTASVCMFPTRSRDGEGSSLYVTGWFVSFLVVLLFFDCRLQYWRCPKLGIQIAVDISRGCGLRVTRWCWIGHSVYPYFSHWKYLIWFNKFKPHFVLNVLLLIFVRQTVWITCLNKLRRFSLVFLNLPRLPAGWHIGKGKRKGKVIPVHTVKA